MRSYENEEKLSRKRAEIAIIIENRLDKIISEIDDTSLSTLDETAFEVWSLHKDIERMLDEYYDMID